jgi:hypothetical protein
MQEDGNHIGAKNAGAENTALLAPTPVPNAQLEDSHLMQPCASPAQLERSIRQLLDRIAIGVHLALTIRRPEAPPQLPASTAQLELTRRTKQLSAPHVQLDITIL